MKKTPLNTSHMKKQFLRQFMSSGYTPVVSSLGSDGTTILPEHVGHHKWVYPLLFRLAPVVPGRRKAVKSTHVVEVCVFTAAGANLRCVCRAGLVLPARGAAERVSVAAVTGAGRAAFMRLLQLWSANVAVLTCLFHRR